MGELKDITMPSGAILSVSLAPFSEAKALYKAALKEIKSLDIKESDEVDLNLFKNLFSTFFASDEIERALQPCMARCLYDGLRIVSNTFENEKAREDYVQVCWEVAHANVSPFLKNLGLLSKTAMSTLAKSSQKQ